MQSSVPGDSVVNRIPVTARGEVPLKNEPGFRATIPSDRREKEFMAVSAFSEVLAHRPTGWANPYKRFADAAGSSFSPAVPKERIRDAELRLQRFAPFI